MGPIRTSHGQKIRLLFSLVDNDFQVKHNELEKKGHGKVRHVERKGTVKTMHVQSNNVIPILLIGYEQSNCPSAIHLYHLKSEEDSCLSHS